MNISETKFENTNIFNKATKDGKLTLADIKIFERQILQTNEENILFGLATKRVEICQSDIDLYRKVEETILKSKDIKTTTAAVQYFKNNFKEVRNKISNNKSYGCFNTIGWGIASAVYLTLVFVPEPTTTTIGIMGLSSLGSAGMTILYAKQWIDGSN